MGPIDVASLKRQHSTLLDRIRDAVAESAIAAGEEANAYVASNAVPFTHRTRDVANKQTYRIVRTSTGAVLKLRNTSKHAAVLEKGSRAHRIVAKRAKALRFVIGGRVFFRKSVWHPGTKPTWFMRTAAERAGVRFQNELAGRLRLLAAQSRRGR